MENQINGKRLDTIIPPLLYWYGEHKRVLPWRESCTPYHVWISEIMLQQTRVEAVKSYYTRFLAQLPTPQALSQVDDERLMKLWEGLGYYSRARNLKKAAARIVSDFDGNLPCDYAALRALPGIGDYTAGAISSIAFGLPYPAVDGNVLRVISRICGSEADITLPETKNTIRAALQAVYPRDPHECSSLTQALMELGAVVCIPNGAPHCDDCPLAGQCTAFAENTVSRIPVKAPKKPRRIEQKTVLLLYADGKFALQKRPSKGLLSGLWEFPVLDGKFSEAALASLPFLRNQIGNPITLQSATHIFTHIEWHMSGYFIKLTAPAPEFVWEPLDAIHSRYALASAIGAYLRQADQIKITDNETEGI